MQAGSEPDAALIDASRRGDHAAFTQVIERYQRAVYAVSFSNVRDRALSDDITQETFVRAWLRLGELRDAERLPGWLCGIARNLARDARKRMHREHVGDPPDVAGEWTPFEAMSGAESERLIAAALAQVPDAYRETLVLFYYGQHGIDEVARMLGISEANAHQRLSRGRRYLAEHVAALVERGVARRGPKRELVASVLAAITVLAPAAHVEASISKGSMMLSKVSVIALVTLAVGTTGALFAVAGDANDRSGVAHPSRASASGAPHTNNATAASTRPRQAAKPGVPPRPHARSLGPPQLAAPAAGMGVPDCATAARHFADLLLARIGTTGTAGDAMRAKLGPLAISANEQACTADNWSESKRLCIVATDDYERAKIDCTDDAVATADEVAALPPDLRCDALAQHAYVLWNGPGGKFAGYRRLAAAQPDRLATVERLTLAARAQLANECDQMPWSVERRKCVAASTTQSALIACP